MFAFLKKSTASTSTNKDKGKCTTCRFGKGGRYDICWVGSYYAEQGKDRHCYEGELWESNSWRYIKDNKANLNAMPKDHDFEVLFDDGTILNYWDDDFPFAEIVAWRELSSSDAEEKNLKENIAFICLNVFGAPIVWLIAYALFKRYGVVGCFTLFYISFFLWKRFGNHGDSKLSILPSFGFGKKTWKLF